MQQSSMLLLFLVALCSGLPGCKQREDVAHAGVAHEGDIRDTADSGFDSSEPPVPPHPPEWVRIDVKAFSFYAPPDLKPIPVQGVDSFVGEYQGDSITLHFDYGRFSNSLDDRDCADYTSNEEQIGGKDAKIASFNAYGENVVGVYFPTAGGEEIRLTVTATGKSPADHDTAKAIFRTIRFPRR